MNFRFNPLQSFADVTLSFLSAHLERRVQGIIHRLPPRGGILRPLRGILRVLGLAREPPLEFFSGGRGCLGFERFVFAFFCQLHDAFEHAVVLAGFVAYAPLA